MRQGSVNAYHNARLTYIKACMPEYELVEIWEHEWDAACKDNSHLKEYLKENEILPPSQSTFVTLSLVVEPTRSNYTTTASLANKLCILIILVYTPLFKSMVFFHQTILE